MTADAVRFPLGPMPQVRHLTPAERQAALANLRDLPARLRSAVTGLSGEQLDTPYREGGWTVRRVVHHVADSHINAYVRTKLALTEDNPTVKPYHEELWAELPDSHLATELSLLMLEQLHARWDAVLADVTAWDRPWTHPESGEWTLDTLLAMYDWHGRHHTAHITGLRERQGW